MGLGIKTYLKTTSFYRAAASAFGKVIPKKPTIYEISAAYDRELAEVMERVLKPSSIACDVGANIGEILQEMIRISPQGRHHAFEPIPELDHELASRYPAVRVHCCALGETTSRAKFRKVLTSLAQSSLKDTKLHGENHKFETIEVEIKRLDDMVPPEDQVALMKLDAEGAEASILRGSVVRSVDAGRSYCWKPARTRPAHSERMPTVFIGS